MSDKLLLDEVEEVEDEGHEARVNFDDGQIRFEPAFWLDKEEYALVTRPGWNNGGGGFQWKRSEECFVRPWSPQAEDWLAEHFGIAELDVDDTDLLALAIDRAERYEGYGSNASKRAEANRKTHDAISSYIPLGQPVMVGHYSEKRHRRDLDRIRRAVDREMQERRKADYWADRAERVIQHASRRYQPGPIFRRIEKLEADRRGWVRMMNGEDPENPPTEGVVAMCERWIWFLGRRLEVARLLYAESGGVKSEREGFTYEKGGAVKYGGRWYPVKRVNQKSVTITHWLGVPSFEWRAEKHKIQGTMSKADWEAADKRATGTGFIIRQPEAVEEQGDE